MASRKTLYLPDHVAEYLGELSDGDSYSARLSGIVQRYRTICRAELPSLSRDEWCAICDANNGCGIEDLIGDDSAGMVGTMLWANVSDSAGLADTWDVDQSSLVRKMRKWTVSQQYAAYEAIRKFWMLTDLPTDDALQQAGMTS